MTFHEFANGEIYTSRKTMLRSFAQVRSPVFAEDASDILGIPAICRITLFRNTKQNGRDEHFDKGRRI